MAQKNGLLATGGLEAKIKLWEWQRERLIHTITDCGDSVTSLRFTREGNRLVAGSRDGTVRFFSCDGKYELLAVLYSLKEGGVLWEIPDGWFFTDRPDDVIEVFECDDDAGNRIVLSKNDPRRRSYISTHNDYLKVKGRMLDKDFEKQIEEFNKLVALHQAMEGTRKLLTGRAGTAHDHKARRRKGAKGEHSKSSG